MLTSEFINEIATALCKAQAVMGGAHKSASNPFFKSKYADLESVIDAIKQPFADNGLSFVQFPSMAESQVTITTRVMHDSGQWLEDTLSLPIAKNDAQAVGSCISYGRRYSLQSIAGIPSVDDDGQSAVQGKPEPLRAITDEQAAEVARLLTETGTDATKFCAAYKVSAPHELSPDQYAGATKILQGRLEK